MKQPQRLVHFGKARFLTFTSCKTSPNTHMFMWSQLTCDLKKKKTGVGDSSSLIKIVVCLIQLWVKRGPEWKAPRGDVPRRPLWRRFNLSWIWSAKHQFLVINHVFDKIFRVSQVFKLMMATYDKAHLGEIVIFKLKEEFKLFQRIFSFINEPLFTIDFHENHFNFIIRHFVLTVNSFLNRPHRKRNAGKFRYCHLRHL